MNQLHFFHKKTFYLFFLLLFCFVFMPEGVFSQSSSTTTLAPPSGSTGSGIPQPLQTVLNDNGGEVTLITQATVLALMSLLPFIIIVLTAFIKIVVVLSLLRSALGVQQAPPNQVINGVALLLSLYVMYPTAVLMYEASQEAVAEIRVPNSLIAPESSTYVIAIAKAAREPFREFIKNNSRREHHKKFYGLVYKMLPQYHRPNLKIDDFLVLVPSYITSQLKDAFEIGVLIYIPFFVVDLVTSNILLAMGMMMLSPVTISMPLKLFLLVMLDGWTMLIEGLVLTFR